MLKTDKQKRLRASVLALAIAAMPLGVHAAGLGKLTVISALGQPLRAEIELTASREEVSSVSARLASPDAFKNAGIEYVPALSGVRFSVDKRPNGQAILVVSSDRAVNDPFMDMLVELNWASGRLVREYTFLLDPPDVLKKPAAPVPVAVPEVKKEAVEPAPAPAVPEAAAPSPAAAPAPEGAVRKAAPAAAKAAEKAPAAKPAEGAATREVKRGDTLAKIANEVKPEGVNLDQMLVALFRSNRDAFIADNMNRLRAGKILSIPDKDTVTAIGKGEARKVVVAQAVDFNAYRKKLAAVAAAAEPAKEETPKQAAAGKITPKVEEKMPAPSAKDKLEVSRTETGKAGKAGAKERAGAAEEELIARDKALKDANSRIAELEKNITDLKKLAEMKSAAGAKLQQEAAKPAVPAAPAPKAEPAPAAKPAAEVALAPVAPPAAEAPKPAVAEGAPPAPKPAPKPAAKKLPPPPPPPPPSFIDDNPLLVYGGGGIVALLLGYLGFNTWRKKRAAAAAAPSSVMASEIADNSVFATTGGQSVDTGASVATDFSQNAVAGATDEGVDPVAEADVYMAYGRDSQAEEILLEALKSDPTRRAIHLKLLEIYAARKNAQQFETVARDLHGLTGGAGSEWEKAAALGRSIDPANALYGGESPATTPAEAAASTVVTSSGELQQAGMDTAAMPGTLSQMAAVAEAEAAAPAPVVAPAAEETPESLDFDLDLGAAPAEAAAPAVETPAATPAPAEEVMSLDFDLDLGATPAVAAEAAPAVAEAAPAVEGLDFDLGTAEVQAPAEAAPVTAPAAETAGGAADEMASVDFDFNLEAPAAPEAAAPAAEPEMPLDLSAINLELGEAPAATAPTEAPLEMSIEMPAVASAEPALEMPAETPAAAPEAGDNPEVATKLELAQAYEEMGDKEGARELLNEVLQEGSPAQQATARAKLDQLG